MTVLNSFFRPRIPMSVPTFLNNNRTMKSRGMTLVEILIVVSILGMLSLALFNALSVGLRVWKKAQEVHAEEDIVILFDKLTADLHNVYLYSKIHFEGGFHSFAFPALVRVQVEDQNKEPAWDEQMGKIEYSYDGSRHAILRRQADYGQALKGTYDEPRVLMSGVKALRFHYLYSTDEGEKWSDVILEGVIAGVDVEVVFEEAFKERVIRKSINIPLGM